MVSEKKLKEQVNLRKTYSYDPVSLVNSTNDMISTILQKYGQHTVFSIVKSIGQSLRSIKSYSGMMPTSLVFIFYQ